VCSFVFVGRGMSKLEWHISKFDFCNGISPKYESCNGIDPINSFIFSNRFSDLRVALVGNFMFR
jgi:hypothetical protein